MEYAVIRFWRKKRPEQWIIPLEELQDHLFVDDTVNKIIIPIIMSEHGQVYNLLFTYTWTNLTTVSGFLRSDTYQLYVPRIEPSPAALEALVAMWEETPHAQKVVITTGADYTYRL